VSPSPAVAYGVGAPPGGPARPVARVGATVLDLRALAAAGLLDSALPRAEAVFDAATLDRFLGAGRAVWEDVGARLGAVDDQGAPSGVVLDGPLAMALPFTVADYVDFYSSLEHATTVGRLLRPGAEPLAPNWRVMPLGYHGRSGTVVVSGTPIRRPTGPVGLHTVGPTERLDVEVEVGFVVGVGTEPGARVAPEAFRDHVFGVVVLADWSARDIQSVESRPLGPFLSKSFATTISAWVTPLHELEDARVSPPPQEPPPPDYLAVTEPWGLDIALSLDINGTVVSRPDLAGMYWTMPQQLAHATVGGAALRRGDLFGTGTISGWERARQGCLLEITANGTDPVELRDGRRSWLADGDTVVIRGTAAPGSRRPVALGECAGTVQPSA
jgi:fumarylacetoacetase